MPRDERRRQKSLQRKAAKRKQKRKSLAQLPPAAGRSVSRLAARWPLHECLVSDNWTEPGALVQILIARRSAEGEIGVAAILVDLGCLGVKDAFTHVLDSQREYEVALRGAMTSRLPMSEVSIDLAARIIREAVAYAASLGFKPHRDYYEAAPFLADADPDASSAVIPVGGPDGRPLFVSGPHDNFERLLAQLTRSVGAGNFTVTVGLPTLPFDLIDIADEADFDLIEDGDDEDDAAPEG
jgi:hypothetical protein